jgi:hypothetical protein
MEDRILQFLFTFRKSVHTEDNLFLFYLSFRRPEIMEDRDL